MTWSRRPRPLAVRFWEKVAKAGPNDCWPWQGGLNEGYGKLADRLAHRLSWEFANGPIPAGLFVLHRCDNPPCVNPAHLFLGSQLDNMRDMAAKGRNWQQKKTGCPRGHEYSVENTYIHNGHRYCRVCNRAAVARLASGGEQ